MASYMNDIFCCRSSLRLSSSRQTEHIVWSEAEFRSLEEGWHMFRWENCPLIYEAIKRVASIQPLLEKLLLAQFRTRITLYSIYLDGSTEANIGNGRSSTRTPGSDHLWFWRPQYQTPFESLGSHFVTCLYIIHI